MPVSKRIRYDTITDGEWFRPRMSGFREMCCDCHLVHLIKYRIVDGRVEFKVFRNDRATAAARRKFKFTKEDD